MPPMMRSLSTISIMMRPGSTRSGACEKYREFGRFGSLVNSGTSLQDDLGHVLGRTGGRGRLEDDELSAA